MEIYLAGEHTFKNGSKADWTGLNILESFYYARENKDFARLSKSYGNLLLDSGAFSFMMNKSRAAVNWDEYVEEGDFYSCCEHHMIPFFGQYHFAYIPNPKGKILGISKIGRVVDYCSARLQLQERLANNIVSMLTEALGEEFPPLGVALVMKGEHLCKTMRGARKKGTMTSCCFTGVFQQEEYRKRFFECLNV